MKKKRSMKIACFLIAAVSAFSLASCDFSSGSDESTAKTAYDLAVENGYKGSVEDWLLSLKGADGEDAASPSIGDIYEAWIDNGNTGSFNDFLNAYLSVSVGEEENTEIVNRCMTSVVNIFNISDYKTTVQSGGFFSQSQTIVYKSVAAGSGVIVDIDKSTGSAYVLTNYHVVYAADSEEENGISDELILYPYGGTVTMTAEYKDYSINGTKKEYISAVNGGEGAVYATYVAGSMSFDIALLKIDGSAVLSESAATAATLAKDSDLTVGQKTYAIGNAKGDGISVTSGVLSVDSEEIEMLAADDKTTMRFRVMRTDAAINNGNSGGGLFNAQGELIGIVNAKYVESSVDNMGYALPVSQIGAVMRNLLDNDGKLIRATLGITVSTKYSSSTWNSEKKKAEIVERVEVVEVSSDGISQGNLQSGDVIRSVKLGDTVVDITRRYLFTEELYNVRKGDTFYITVLRNGEERTFSFNFEDDAYFTEVS